MLRVGSSRTTPGTARTELVSAAKMMCWSMASSEASGMVGSVAELTPGSGDGASTAELSDGDATVVVAWSTRSASDGMVPRRGRMGSVIVKVFHCDVDAGDGEADLSGDGLGDGWSKLGGSEGDGRVGADTDSQ